MTAVTRRIFLTGTAALLAAPAISSAAATDLNDSAPDFSGIESWLNSEALRIGDLRGKVVLVDFWTFACVNCARTLPYVTKWHETYAARGFTVVGIHTPEFPFERDRDNLKAAMARFGIRYPVAQDNRYVTWKAYGVRYWPTSFLLDRQGKVVLLHEGEGSYDETEARISALLRTT